MKIFSVVVGLVCCVTAYGAAPTDLSPLLRPFAEEHNLPGVIAAVVHGDHVVSIGSAGVRKIGDSTAFESGDLIHLGSDTKAMTAILIGQLIDKGQIKFDDSMRDVFPDVAGKMNQEMAKVTVRDLLNHTGGLPHDLKWGELTATRKPLIEQRRMAVEKALAAEPAQSIGKYSYSNVGYVLLGAIVESKTGKPWEQVIEGSIFRPLRMDTAGFGPPGTLGKTDEPWGHVMKDGKLSPVHYDNPPVMSPAGRVHCSMEDWGKFISEVLRASRGQPTLLSAKTFKDLTTPREGQIYAGGWIIGKRDWAGGTTLSHAGSNRTWYCVVWIAPAKDAAYMVATNYGGDEVEGIADQEVGKLIWTDQGGH